MKTALRVSNRYSGVVIPARQQTPSLSVSTSNKEITRKETGKKDVQLDQVENPSVTAVCLCFRVRPFREVRLFEPQFKKNNELLSQIK